MNPFSIKDIEKPYKIIPENYDGFKYKLKDK